jgi:hypothetical protein
MKGTIERFIKDLFRYQKKNGIVGQCITNAQYFRDSAIASGADAKSIAVIALTKDKKLVVHMVVEIEGVLLDPSYEIASTVDTYYRTYKEIRDDLPFIESIGLSPREFLKTFLEFIDMSKRQNEGEIIADKEYYNALADYVEGKN